MSFITYKQADSRWGKKNYNGSSTMATAGCGPSACAMIAYAIDGKTTPLDTMRYMQKHGYAIRNQGTSWYGIKPCLEAFGLKDVRWVNDISDAFSLMAKGYVGLFLFVDGTRGGIRWTSSGHFIAVTDYKVKNGKHYIYTRDSGNRDHTGWYCYETQMKGLIRNIWLGYIEDGIVAIKKPTGKYSGTVPKPTIKKRNKGEKVKNLQLFLNWYGKFGLKVDGKCGDITVKAIKVFQKTEGLKVDGEYGEKSYSKAKTYEKAKIAPPKPTPKPKPAKKPYQGIFPALPPKTAKLAVEYAYAYGTKLSVYKYEGGKPKEAYKKGLNKAYPNRKRWKYAKSRAGASCDVFAGTVLKNSGYKSAPHQMSKMVSWCRKNLKKVDKIQNGDIGTRTNHVEIFLDLKGRKYVANAHYQNHGGTYGIIEKVGSYTAIWRPDCPSVLEKGDKFTSVIHLQRFLNWYGNYGIKEDYIYGNKTVKAVEDFQKKEGLSVTGIFTAKDLEAAKKVRK